MCCVSHSRPLYAVVFVLQLRQLNTSVKSLLTSMGDAPYMKSLPGDVKEVKGDVARFGSRMTEMETQLATVHSSLTELKQQAQKSAEVRDLYTVQLLEFLLSHKKEHF